MAKEILLLCEEIEAAALTAILEAAAPGVTVTHVATLDELEAAAGGEGQRLVAFCTPVIVPAAVLDALAAPAYNFHPGPPTYPGIYPAVFAIYEGAARFGATAHVMTSRVDAGAIVGVEWFDVDQPVDRLTLETQSHAAVMRLFRRLAPALAASDSPLAPTGEAWSGRKTTRKDFEALCRLPPDVDRQELLRRYLAVGEGPAHALRITIHGLPFRLDGPDADAPIYVGGRAVKKAP